MYRPSENIYSAPNPRGGTQCIHDEGGVRRSFIVINRPKEIHKPERLDQKKYKASKFPTPKKSKLKADFQSVLRTLKSLFNVFCFDYHVRRHKM